MRVVGHCRDHVRKRMPTATDVRPHELVGPYFIPRDDRFDNETVLTKRRLDPTGLLEGVPSIHMNAPPNLLALLRQISIASASVDLLVKVPVGGIVGIDIAHFGRLSGGLTRRAKLLTFRWRHAARRKPRAKPFQ